MRILKKVLGVGLFVLAVLLTILTIAYFPYALIMVTFINVPLLDVLKIVGPVAIFTIGLAWVCKKAGQSLLRHASTPTAE